MILDGGLGALIFIVFAVLAALSGLGKAGKGTGAPRRPLPGPPPPRRTGGPPAGGSQSVGPGRARAEVLVPDDLWAVLTGERRPAAAAAGPAEPGRPSEAPALSPAAARSRFEEEIVGAAEAPAPWRAAPKELSTEPGAAAAARTLVPVAPSLMVPSAPSGAAVSTGGAPLASQPRAPRGAPGPLAPRLGALAGGDLGRAFVLAAVLGPPKALE